MGFTFPPCIQVEWTIKEYHQMALSLLKYQNWSFEKKHSLTLYDDDSDKKNQSQLQRNLIYFTNPKSFLLHMIL